MGRTGIIAPDVRYENGIPDETHGQMDFARRQRLVGLDASLLDVVHLGEPLALQEGFGHILWGETGTTSLNQFQRFVSGGGSAPTSLGYRPRTPAVPAGVNPPRNARRVQPSARWIFMATS